MADIITINDLEVYAYHGVNESEKKYGQRFLITVEMAADIKEAAQTDDISKTVNYAAVAKAVRYVFTADKFNLIETAAERTAQMILSAFERVSTVKVTVKKPDAPMKGVFDSVSVSIVRSRQ